LSPLCCNNFDSSAFTQDLDDSAGQSHILVISSGWGIAF
jgi:hypothetical protein